MNFAIQRNFRRIFSDISLQALRKNATEQEKSEFLKEALLMSNFKHRHILQLLGICVDNDPHFIIMELMEGGDLLSYLRSNRSTAVIIANFSITLFIFQPLFTLPYFQQFRIEANNILIQIRRQRTIPDYRTPIY